ncbi:MAG: ABC transporter ATP-binding protein, partial [Clostridia bacterium]
LYLGRCVEKAPTRELFAHPMHPYTKALLSAILIPDISARDKPMEIIRGEVPSPVNPPLGCRFSGRCPHCTKACMGEDPTFREIATGHFVACPLAESLV